MTILLAYAVGNIIIIVVMGLPFSGSSLQTADGADRIQLEYILDEAYVLLIGTVPTIVAQSQAYAKMKRALEQQVESMGFALL